MMYTYIVYDNNNPELAEPFTNFQEAFNVLNSLNACQKFKTHELLIVPVNACIVRLD